MRWSSLNTPLGLTDTSHRKMSGEGLGVLGGVLGLMGSFIDSGNVAATNETNRWMNITTNNTNREINEQQLAWEREKYRQEVAENRFLVDQAYQRELENRSYNSPQKVKERYLKAGINPYLAMYQGATGGSQPSIGSTVGSPPKHTGYQPIPAQQGAPAVPYTGFGMGIRNSLATFFQFRDAERSDYALANQINVSSMEAYAKLMDAATNAKKAGMDEKWINEQISYLRRSMALEEDKFAVSNELNQKYLALEDRKVAVSEAELLLKQYQTEADIRLSNQQIGYLAQLITQSASEIKVNEDNAQRYGSLVSAQVIHLLNSDSEAFERLGIDKEMMSSTKFRNYVGSVADGLWTAAGLYFGIRSGRAPNPIKGFGR